MKTGQVTQHQELSQRPGRSLGSITRWLTKYRRGGLARLLMVKVAPGAEAKIQGEALEKLKQRLKSPEGFSSYRAIVECLEHLGYGLKLKYDTVNWFVREKLKAKLKALRWVSWKQNVFVLEGFKKLPSWNNGARGYSWHPAVALPVPRGNRGLDAKHKPRG